MKVTTVVASRISVNDHIQTVTKKKDACDTNIMICKYFLFQFNSIKPTSFSCIRQNAKLFFFFNLKMYRFLHMNIGTKNGTEKLVPNIKQLK